MPGQPQNAVVATPTFYKTRRFLNVDYTDVYFTSVTFTNPPQNANVYGIVINPGNQTNYGDGTTRTFNNVGPLAPNTSYTFTLYADTNIPDNSVTLNLTTGGIPPNPPTSVAAVAGNASATVSWNAPASNGGLAITGYKIVCSDGSTPIFVGNVLTATYPNLVNETAVIFAVYAINSAGTSGSSVTSNTITPSTSSGATAPGAPTNITVVAGPNSVTVSWTAPASNGGSPITGYTVTPSVGSPVTVGNVLTATLTGLASGTSVTFTVSAINAIGGTPNPPVSPPVTPTPPAASPPSSVLGVTGVPAVASAIISWSAPLSSGGSPITGYKVICIPDNKKPNLAGPNDRSLTVIGIKNAVKTMYTVVAINAAGQSDSVELTAYPLPGAPKVTALRGASGIINLSWTAKPANVASPITGYAVSLVSPLPAPAGMVIPTPLVTATGGSVNVSGLTNGSPYVFLVKSVSNIGQGVGGLSKALIAAGLPDVPSAFTGTRAVASAGFSWVAPTNTGGLPITGYKISYTVTGLVKILLVKVVTSAIIKGLVNGTAYSFTIQAITLAGGSAQSAPVTVTPGLGL